MIQYIIGTRATTIPVVLLNNQDGEPILTYFNREPSMKRMLCCNVHLSLVSLLLAIIAVGGGCLRQPDMNGAKSSVSPLFPDQTAVEDLDAQLALFLDSHSQGRGLEYFMLPGPNEYDKIPQDPNNPLTKLKVQLGRLLYHETALGVNNVSDEGYETYSCAACHFSRAGFMANLPQGIGEGGIGFGDAGEARSFSPLYDCFPYVPDCQPIRSPSVLNGAYQELMLWNGQFGGVAGNIGTEDKWTPGTPLASNNLGLQGLETQAHGGLQAHRMIDVGLSKICAIPRYQRLYALVFPGEPEPINRLNTALAIAAYERTLLANEAPFQKWLAGNKTAMTESEKLGAILFFGKANCVSCHTGPALNSMTFHAMGMNDLDGSYDSRVNLTPFGGTVPADTRKGRGGFTGHPEDEYKFKTPQLYNLADSPFYGHGASFGTLREVVEYFNTAVPENPIVPDGQLAVEFVPLGLSDDEMDNLVAFLTHALHDGRLDRYEPKRLPSGNCFPANDPQSQLDLGCNPLSVAEHSGR